jgi:uncharacterized protein (TIGR02246 family)
MPDDSGVQRVVAEFADAWNRHDPAAFAAVFAEDADFTNVAGKSLHGRDRIQAFHSKMFSTRFKDSHMTAEQVAVRWVKPDVAAVDVHWSMTGARDDSGAERPPRAGVLIWVVAQTGDRLSILVMHNQELNHPAPGASAAPSPPDPSS